MQNKINAENIKVAIRFKPVKDEEFHVKIDNSNLEISDSDKDSHKFIFDHIFDQETSQSKIFSILAKTIIDWVCQGYNATIFAYGSTGSGKSFTMFGHEDTKTNPGIIPRACEQLFSLIEKKEDVMEANMKCSFLEIYKEHIRDLLKKTDNELKLRQSPVRGVFVQGITEKYVYSSSDILSTIKEGISRRTTGSTALNNVSSRSHSVITLTLTQILSDGVELTSKLNLVDLAGSENVNKSEVQGISLTEAQTINKSLSCLGNVIYALTEKNREHIPYRDSKLTFLLQDSLGGNSKTVLISTISSEKTSYFETLNTLKFAKRAKEIQNIPKVNRYETVQNLLKTIDELNQRIKELEQGQIKIEPQNKDEVNQNSFEPQSDEENEMRILTINKELEKYSQLFEAQRNMTKTIAKELTSEKLKNCLLIAELEQYKLFYNETKDLVNKPELLSRLVDKSDIQKDFKDANILLNPETRLLQPDLIFLEDGSVSL